MVVNLHFLDNKATKRKKTDETPLGVCCRDSPKHFGTPALAWRAVPVAPCWMPVPAVKRGPLSCWRRPATTADVRERLCTFHNGPGCCYSLLCPCAAAHTLRLRSVNYDPTQYVSQSPHPASMHIMLHTVCSQAVRVHPFRISV